MSELRLVALIDRMAAEYECTFEAAGTLLADGLARVARDYAFADVSERLVARAEQVRAVVRVHGRASTGRS